MKARRAPATITLVLIGSAALHGCGGDDSPPTQRDIYRTRADCQADWGADPKSCEPARSGSHAGYFYGPTYHGSGNHAPGTTSIARYGSRSIGTNNVSRGGLGSSASSHSSGG